MSHRSTTIIVLTTIYLNLHAPKHPSPRLLLAGATLTTNESDRLTIPVFHQVKGYTSREPKGQTGVEFEETVAKVHREYILLLIYP